MKVPRNSGDRSVHNVTLELSPSFETEENRTPYSALSQGQDSTEVSTRSKSTQRTSQRRRTSPVSKKTGNRMKLTDLQRWPDVTSAALEIQSSKCKLIGDTSNTTANNVHILSLDSTISSVHSQQEENASQPKTVHSCANRVCKRKILASLQQDESLESLPTVHHPLKQIGPRRPSLAVTYHSRSDLFTFCKSQDASSCHNLESVGRKPVTCASMYKQSNQVEEFPVGVSQCNFLPNHTPSGGCGAASTQTLPELIQTTSVKNQKVGAQNISTITFGSLHQSSPDHCDGSSIDPSSDFLQELYDSLNTAETFLSSYLRSRRARQVGELNKKTPFTLHSVVGHSSVIHCSSPRPAQKIADPLHDGGPVLPSSLCAQEARQRKRRCLAKLEATRQEIIKGIRKKSNCRYPDPFEGASSRFCKRISELSTLVSQTIRWENHKASKITGSKTGSYSQHRL